MAPTLTRPRRRYVVAAAVAGVLALAVTVPNLADATDRPDPASGPVDPLTPISSDGSTLDPSALGAPEAGELAGFEGTATTGPDGADHTVEPPATGDGGYGTTSVIGGDGRSRVSPTTGSVAARSTVQLISGSGYTCTGWMFGPDTVITAGHCVFDPTNDTWRTGIRAWPGRDGDKTPYGSCTAKSLHTTQGWKDFDRDYDMGAVKLNCKVGNTTGWLGVWTTSANIDGKGVTVRGYPCDKASGTQWYDADSVHTDTTNHRIYYRADTYNCQSGGPVYSNAVGDCGGPCVLGIHTTGTTINPDANGGTRFTEGKIDLIRSWRNSL